MPAAVRVGGPGDDRLVGTAAADRLVGQGGEDVLRGLAGADELRGGRGADRLFGGRGDDQLFGGRDPDALRGGAGPDLLDGGRGADVLIGGGGADVFRIRPLGAVDRVLDFDQAAGDQLDVVALRVSLGPEHLVEDFIRMQPVAEGTLVAVDESGSGAAFVDATLLVDTAIADPKPVGDPIPQPVAPSGIAVLTLLTADERLRGCSALKLDQPVALVRADRPVPRTGSGRFAFWSMRPRSQATRFCDL